MSRTNTILSALVLLCAHSAIAVCPPARRTTQAFIRFPLCSGLDASELDSFSVVLDGVKRTANRISSNEWEVKVKDGLCLLSTKLQSATLPNHCTAENVPGQEDTVGQSLVAVFDVPCVSYWDLQILANEALEPDKIPQLSYRIEPNQTFVCDRPTGEDDVPTPVRVRISEDDKVIVTVAQASVTVTKKELEKYSTDVPFSRLYKPPLGQKKTSQGRNKTGDIFASTASEFPIFFRWKEPKETAK